MKIKFYLQRVSSGNFALVKPPTDQIVLGKKSTKELSMPLEFRLAELLADLHHYYKKRENLQEAWGIYLLLTRLCPVDEEVKK